MDESRLREIEGYATEARERERKQDYHVRGSTEGKPSPSDDIVMLCEDVSGLTAEVWRLKKTSDYADVLAHHIAFPHASNREQVKEAMRWFCYESNEKRG